MTKDYTLTMQDSRGNCCVVFISGDCIDEQIAYGASVTEATEEVEDNAIEVAQRQGNIGTDCWIVSINK